MAMGWQKLRQVCGNGCDELLSLHYKFVACQARGIQTSMTMALSGAAQRRQAWFVSRGKVNRCKNKFRPSSVLAVGLQRLSRIARRTLPVASVVAGKAAHYITQYQSRSCSSCAMPQRGRQKAIVMCAQLPTSQKQVVPKETLKTVKPEMTLVY
jgi:hypothetical protein